MTYNDLLQAYYDCRHSKRRTANALKFEIDYESRLLRLWEEIESDRYWPGRSITFTVDKPVLREIFAADFRDRIVHHLIINKLNPLFEKWFIYDSYACRTGRGTLFGIKRINRFIRQCSHNYTRDCYVLKLDISGFFMSIDKQVLWTRLRQFIRERYTENDINLLEQLCHKVIWHDPTQQYLRRVSISRWKDLPANKSLFGMPAGKGIPIGNLTSQVFANFYMSFLDHFIKHDLGMRYYGRYVDDLVLIHESKEQLHEIREKIRVFVERELHMQLHPRKMYLQSYAHGVSFTGFVIYKQHIVAQRRVKANLYQAIQRHNAVIRAHHTPSSEEIDALLSSINSYLGILRWHNTCHMRRAILYKHLSGWWWNHVTLNADATVLRRRTRRLKKMPVV